MSKIKIIEKPFGKKKFLVLFGKKQMDTFSTKEAANDYASMYLVPPYTMDSNKWFTQGNNPAKIDSATKQQGCLTSFGSRLFRL